MSGGKRPHTRPGKGARAQKLAKSFNTAVQNHAAGRLPQAEAAYRKLLAAEPKNARLHHLLGRLLHEKGNTEAAIKGLRIALKLAPDDPPALNDLGLIYKDSGQLEDATTCFNRLLELSPESGTTHNNLGLVHRARGLHRKAVEAFTKAVEFNPKDAGARCNLGNALKSLEDFDGAATAYREALALDPKMLDAYPTLAAVLRRLDRLDEASEVFTQWLEHDPDNPVALHLRDAGAASSEDGAPARASEGYVRDVFDKFAETYDEHLAKLHNQGPSLIVEAVTKHHPAGTDAELTILDAGCGTGLCGGHLRPLARRLVGVDLSPKMIERAEQLGCYDALVVADLVEFMNAAESVYDLVVSGDTFGYFGDLEAATAAMRCTLKPGGRMIATFETADEGDPDYQLMKSGRYQHAPRYLERVLTEGGLAMEAMTSATLREEAGSPVACVVVSASLEGY